MVIPWSGARQALWQAGRGLGVAMALWPVRNSRQLVCIRRGRTGIGGDASSMGEADWEAAQGGASALAHCLALEYKVTKCKKRN